MKTPAGPAGYRTLHARHFRDDCSQFSARRVQVRLRSRPGDVAVARSIQPELDRCGPKNKSLCVSSQPRLIIGGRGVTISTFLANSNYREYLSQKLAAVSVDMETAAFAHVAYANSIPFLAFRALSDQAGGTDYKEVGVFFGSGLAETNESRVTLAFLRAWSNAHPNDMPHSSH